MSDDFDRASARETEERDAIIASRKRFPLPAMAAPCETVYCVDCDDEIPAARLAAVPTARRCTFCEEPIRRHRKLRGKG
ncbi:TraR/DksA C4-type zinc finger protein [Parvibaculum sp.]|uniref:TraR/DksA C4-type zinc finger protein n=1 Tax=Parvibaculum sp. TaxID=2024848 RepID=UPI0027364846|nr:TraR/DksA C4-type zinc finger protein [Parvibaculum sp.]MDP3329406.1 TraR/DksA C4-type zinc finger protein [Parvibaculum sp.]